MTWTQDLVKIRRLIRDPDGNIWDDAQLLNIHNDVQKDFQNRTSILEGYEEQSMPNGYDISYTVEWEYAYIPSTATEAFQCLRMHEGYTICHRWEALVVDGIDVAISDPGVHWTHPFEAFMGKTPGDVVRMRFPSNLRNLKYFAYDDEPIVKLSKKRVQSCDRSYLRSAGEPRAFYMFSESNDEYVLYPRPSDPFDETATMIFDIDPTDFTTGSDTGDYPEFLKKYIRFGVIARAYGANTDGRIRSLARFWGMRYEIGVKLTKRFRRNQKVDRDYRLTTHSEPKGRQHRHPRLPDAYPAVNP